MKNRQRVVGVLNEGHELGTTQGDDTVDKRSGVSKRSVDALIEKGDAKVIRDSVLPGFGARLNRDATVTYFFEYRAGRGRAFPVRREVLGHHGELTPAEARKMAEGLRARVRDQRLPIDERDLVIVRRREKAAIAEERDAPTVTAILDRYIAEEVEITRKRTTIGLYRLYRRHLDGEIGHIRARALNNGHVSAAHRAIGSGKNARQVTANRSVTFLKAALNWAVKRQLLPKDYENPAKAVTRFREVGRERFLSGEELARIGAALQQGETIGLPFVVDDSRHTSRHAPKLENRYEKLDPFAAVAIRLLILTGLRLREVLHLEWRNVDFERGVLTLPDTKTGRRFVPLGASALAVLRGVKRIGSYVIASSTAGSKSERPRADLKRPWSSVCRFADLKGVRIHDLRHTFAATGAGGGLGLPVIGALLGHRNIETTQRYAHLADTPVKAAADRIAGELADALGLLPRSAADVQGRYGRTK